MTEMVTISFEGSITLPIETLDGFLGDAVQAVQNEVGYTGALVISATVDHVDDEEPDEISLDALADRERAEADRYWPTDEESE